MTVVVGGSSPQITFADSTVQNTAALPLTGGTLTGGLTLATWTTSGRPSTPATGTTGYNTTYGGVEVYNGSAWDTITGGPAFSAYLNLTQTLSAATLTKIQFNTKEFDTASCYDNVTNYRFTPTVAGYYQITAAVGVASSPCAVLTFVYKNGNQFKLLSNGNTANVSSLGGAALIYFNGSTDYVEIYGYFGTSQNVSAGVTTTWFQAAMVRSA